MVKPPSLLRVQEALESADQPLVRLKHQLCSYGETWLPFAEAVTCCILSPNHHHRYKIADPLPRRMLDYPAIQFVLFRSFHEQTGVFEWPRRLPLVSQRNELQRAAQNTSCTYRRQSAKQSLQLNAFS